MVLYLDLPYLRGDHQANKATMLLDYVFDKKPIRPQRIDSFPTMQDLEDLKEKIETNLDDLDDPDICEDDFELDRGYDNDTD